MYISEFSGAKKKKKKRISSSQMSHPSYSWQLGNCIWSIHQDNCTGLNARPLEWGDQVALFQRSQQYAGLVCVYLSPESERSLRINTELFWVIDFTLWWSTSILMGVVPPRMTMFPSWGHEGTQNLILFNPCESYELREVPDQRV